MTGEPYTVFGYKGKQVRDNIHADDVVRAFEAFAAAPRPAAVYNLGGGRASNVSMLEAIARCEEHRRAPARLPPVRRGPDRRPPVVRQRLLGLRTRLPAVDAAPRHRRRAPRHPRAQRRALDGRVAMSSGGGRNLVERRRAAVVDRFHRLYYDAMDRTWKDTYWRGVRTAKCPMDMWIYQEILWENRPDLVIECGTAWGGSALFFASMMDLLGAGSS
jgi:nucleoside-diphosphate-sugar epimerase